MKVEELMIGDWVVSVDNDNEPCRIETLGKCDVDTDGLDEVSYERLTPIPITPEIMKKNGFRILWNGDFELDTSSLSINFFNRVDCYTLCIQHSLTLILNIRIKYVHELQHAFRLCGIKKEIVL